MVHYFTNRRQQREIERCKTFIALVFVVLVLLSFSLSFVFGLFVSLTHISSIILESRVNTTENRMTADLFLWCFVKSYGIVDFSSGSKRGKAAQNIQPKIIMDTSP